MSFSLSGWMDSVSVSCCLSFSWIEPLQLWMEIFYFAFAVSIAYHQISSDDSPYANNKGAVQHAHPHLQSLISAFVVHFLDIIIPVLAKSKISILQLVSVSEQALFSLTRSETQTDFLVTWLRGAMAQQILQTDVLSADLDQLGHPCSQIS